MEAPLSPELAPPDQTQTNSSLASLLRQGICSARQHHYPEAMTAFTLASKQLAPHQAGLASLLDAFSHSYQRYTHTLQELSDGIERLALAESERQQVVRLERLAPDLVRSLEVSSPASTFPIHVLPERKASAQTAHPGLMLPALEFTCFGHFQVRRLGQVVALCPNRKGQAILRYLVAKPGHRESLDKLMEMLCRDEAPEIGRHKLEVALSALRCSLNQGCACEPGGGYILYRDGFYQLHPAVRMQTDVEEFLELYQAGCQASGEEVVACFERACSLYTAPFLTEDLYADWSFLRREQLSQVYLKMCHTLAEYALQHGRYEEVVRWSTASLGENRCDEATHQQLIRAYLAQGRRSDALRQYEWCRRVLDEELGMPPLPETRQLLGGVLKHELFPDAERQRQKIKTIEPG